MMLHRHLLHGRRAFVITTVWILLISILSLFLMMGTLFYAIYSFSTITNYQSTFPVSYEMSLFATVVKNCFSYYDPYLMRTSTALIDEHAISAKRLDACAPGMAVSASFRSPAFSRRVATASWHQDDMVLRMPIVLFNATTLARTAGELDIGIDTGGAQ